MTTATTPYFRAVLHSYSMLFFSQHRGFAVLLLLVTFSHPVAGVAGLASALLAVGGARLGGFNREWTATGAYSFNSLLTGLALASFYAPGWALAGLVVVGAGLALLLSVALGGWLGSRGLPFLSLPFLGTVWLLMLGSGPLLHLAAGEAAIYWLNDVYALGGPRLVRLAQWVGDWPWPPLLATYLRALGAVLFQDNAAAGLLVALGLLWHSRIAFSLSVLAFLGAYGLAMLTGPAPGGLNEYNLGANYVVAAIAVGSVFVIPSAASYGWALGSVPVTVVLLAGLTAALDKLGLPTLSLPYCATALLFLYVLLLRERAGGGPVLTPVQRYSPERNLYAYATDRVRLAHQGAVALTLPFLGAWRCTQGYLDGGPTHQGPWGQALDFAIADADGLTYQGPGLSLSDFYAYNKPVLAPADGVVEHVVQHIEDNAIGEVNLAQNWGNTVVLRHAPGLYTQLSHLRVHSVPVKVGDHVRRGEIIGTCGSSGRSPEPHLHFQVQATPYVGSRTLAYPLAYFMALGLPDSVSGEPDRLSGSPDGVSGSSDGVSGEPDALSGSSVGVSGEPDALSGSSVGVSGEPDALSGSSVGVSQGGEVLVKRPHTARQKPHPPQLRHFTVPVAGETISPPAFNRTLSQALRFPPGYALDVRDADAPDAPAQRWEVFTDAYSLAYLRCQHTGAVAYFAGDESVFYCTAFYGPETSWLYLFYQAAYRVPLVSQPGQVVRDEFPLSVVRNAALTWLQDVVAPFHRFLKPTFLLEEIPSDAGSWPGRAVRLRSRVAVARFGRAQVVQVAELTFQDGALVELRVQRADKTVSLACSIAGA
ncbi:urea transporter [Hymenobacter terricola]|uniref:urea transporter n=1 Tax=Hymenobacter terricola TaxID=2819236 RepID=UPI001B316716|nr:urea transporter [Hymenobacter terricola]